ncbi:MAG: PfkB family carbohydrate kinase [Ilumatobacter sp.]|uniref:PfkB family carbohydrate kinase n=1 Tax=Ilumatobacter sp. TaxID=1967498 RepID=UPI0026027A61|nr:PfkB family carbohydrate kinase [Ilumatobacter sp.]MDJ0771089.1 PfkB family carbohydrate kinase [Ilumatobacter sp.]
MIIVAGEALIDLVIEPDGSATAALGGAPYNTARVCGRLDADVAFAGAISVDRFGTMLADQLSADGVSLERAVRCELPTTLAAAELDERGAATYRFYIDATSAPSYDVPIEIGEGDVLFAGGLGLVLEPMATCLESSINVAHGRAVVMIDVNCRPRIVPDREQYVARVLRLLANADIVKVSDEDLAYLMPEDEPLDAARAVLESGARAVLVTAGAEAVQVLCREGETTVPVPAVDVVDTIGAGDAFGGGFLAWWTASEHTSTDLERLETLTAATAAAITVSGVVCQRRGADAPRRAELPADWSA